MRRFGVGVLSLTFVGLLGCVHGGPREQSTQTDSYPCRSIPKKMYDDCGCSPQVAGLIDILGATRIPETAKEDFSECVNANASVRAKIQANELFDVGAVANACLESSSRRRVEPAVLDILKGIIEKWRDTPPSPGEMATWGDCKDRVTAK